MIFFKKKIAVRVVPLIKKVKLLNLLNTVAVYSKPQDVKSLNTFLYYFMRFKPEI